MKPFISAIDHGLKECFEDLETALDGLSDDEINWRPTLESNNIDWLVWHMARVEDNWMNIRVKQTESLWDRQGWAQKIGVQESGNGWGQDAEKIRSMPKMDIHLLMQYYSDVRDETSQYFESMQKADLDKIVHHPSGDPSLDWTYSQVLGHLICEEAQHLGQIAYIRGMIRGIDK